MPNFKCRCSYSSSHNDTDVRCSDWKKLTIYYVADSYINLNRLVTDLFKLYKTRIWMSPVHQMMSASSVVTPSIYDQPLASALEKSQPCRDSSTRMIDTGLAKIVAATTQPSDLFSSKSVLRGDLDKHSAEMENSDSPAVQIQSSDSSSDQSPLHSSSDTHSTGTDSDLIDDGQETDLEDEEAMFYGQGEDRVLNPGSYFDKLEAMERAVASNSAIQLYRSFASMPSDQRLHCAEVGCNLRLCSRVQPSKSASIYDLYLPRHFSPRDHPEWSHDLLECRNILVRSIASVRRMQDAKYCNGTFNLLVVDSDRESIARLLPLEITTLYSLFEAFESACKRLGESYHYMGREIQIRISTMDLTSRCQDLLKQLGLAEFKPLDPPVLWRRVVHVLDLALLSYAGAHLEAFDEKYTGQKFQAFHLSDFNTSLQAPAHDEEASQPLDILLRRRRLQCLDEFLGHQEVWVFHLEPKETHSRKESRLLLSTRIKPLHEVWGPVWKSSKRSNQKSIYEYNIGNGVIVPWRQPGLTTGSGTVRVETGERFCHWISSKTYDAADIQLHQQGVLEPFFDGTEILLIGAPETGSSTSKPACDIACRGPNLRVNSSCALSFADLTRIKHVLWTKGALRVPRTRRPRRVKESQSVQVQASAMGFASLANTTTYKRRVGHSMKDVLVERWRNGVWNPAELASYGGVEVSLCSKHARRRRLLDILGSQTIRKYLSSIPYRWYSEKCKEDYFQALSDPKAFYRFWKYNRKYRESVGEAISICLDALQETGVNEENHELSALWVENYDEDKEADGEAGNGFGEDSILGKDQCEIIYDDFAAAEEWIVKLFKSEHTWTEFLQDSSTCLTVAIMDSACLTLDSSTTHGQDCQMSHSNKPKHGMITSVTHGQAVLQTAVQINESILSDEGLRCDGKAWNISSVKKGARFSLGDQGSLTVYAKPSPCLKPPLCVEWHSVKGKKLQEFKDLSINEDLLGKGPEKHHQEYIRGKWVTEPLQVLVLSKSNKATLCANQGC